MTTTPPRKTGASPSRRKRPASASTASPADETIVTPETEASDTATDAVMEAASSEASVNTDAGRADSKAATPAIQAKTTHKTDEPDFEDLPPLLVGEFISREDWTDHGIPRNDLGHNRSEEEVIARVKRLSRSMGWILISAGLVGIVIPGVIGTPFVLLGGLVLWPGNHKILEKWRRDSSPRLINGAMKQVDRFLDDLEHRYPSSYKY